MNKRIARAAALLAVVVFAGFAPLRAAAQLLPPLPLPPPPPLPLPTGSLIVTVTSPASGATVSGTIPVNASVSIIGSLTVSQVQFYRDGNLMGGNSSAPYSVSWNTTSTNNGSHTLTAVATDILGVRWNSDPVSVTVSNAPPAPRIASFSPASGPVGTTVTISGTNFSGATAVTFNTVSAGFVVDSATSMRAQVPSGATSGPIRVTTPGGTATSASGFVVTASAPTITSFSPASGPVGTTVTISGTNFSGATAVRFNGVSASFTAGSATSITATVPSGATTGPISVTTSGGTATSSSAFTVEAPPPSGTQRFEETDPAVVGSPAGAWVRRGPEVAAFSGGTAASSDVSGATATFSFTGTAVSWFGLKCSICGIATVSIDGGAATSVDTAGPAAPGSPGLTSEAVFKSPPLGAGSHTMVITVTGTTTSGGAQIVVDAFDVTGGTASAATRIEDTDPAVSYTGTWAHNTDARATGGTYAETNVAGAVATLSFTGTEVRWLGFTYDGAGIARVSVDGTFAGEVDTYSVSPVIDPVVFTATGLTRGPHTLTIEVTGRRNAAASDSWVIIDAFDVTP